MIVEAAIVGDISDGTIGFDEEASGSGEPSLHDELVGGDAENAFDKSREANRGEAGTSGERTRRDGVIAMGFEIFQSAGEAGGDTFAVTGSAQIAGNADDTDDDAEMIAHRKFGRETPAWATMRVPMEFQMVDDPAAGADDVLILDGVKLG